MQFPGLCRVWIFLAACTASVAQEAPIPQPQISSSSATTAILTSDEIKALVRQVAEKDIENDKRQRNYTYTQREVEQKLDGKGNVRSTETKTYDVMVLYDEQVKRLVAKNDKPLSEKEATKEEERIQKIIEKHKNESEGDRRKRLAKQDKQREEAREFVEEVSDAYNFQLVKIQSMDGRPTYVIDAEPRAGFKARRKEAKMLSKFRFRVWIDQQEKQWVKLDAECTDTVSFGFVLARVHKGSRILIDQTRVNDEVWLPRHVAVKIDAKVALLKNVDFAVDVAFHDYKKFGADSKIIGYGELSGAETTK